MQIDQDLYAALYVLGFNFLDGDRVSGEIAEIKGYMTIKLVHPPGEELKFVVELPDEKQMIFTVDRHQIVSIKLAAFGKVAFIQLIERCTHPSMNGGSSRFDHNDGVQ